MKRKDDSIKLMEERLRILELKINSEMVSQYFPRSAQPAPQAVSGNNEPCPQVPQPPSQPAPQTSQNPLMTCNGCTDLSRKVEILMTEVGYIRTSTNGIREEITSISTMQHNASVSSQQIQTEPLQPLHSASNHKTVSRHTQTRRSKSPSPNHSRSSPKGNDQCLWQSGIYPSGPVNHLQSWPATSSNRQKRGPRNANRRVGQESKPSPRIQVLPQPPPVIDLVVPSDSDSLNF